MNLEGLERDGLLAVGVSGGADSLALLHLLHEAGYPLIVCHFNHRLRPEAEADAVIVGAVAEKLGLPFETGSGAVSEALPGGTVGPRAPPARRSTPLNRVSLGAEVQETASWATRGIDERLAHEVAHGRFPHVAKVVRTDARATHDSPAQVGLPSRRAAAAAGSARLHRHSPRVVARARRGKACPFAPKSLSPTWARAPGLAGGSRHVDYRIPGSE